MIQKQRQPEFFDGNVLKWGEIAGLTIGEISYDAGLVRSKHIHRRACFHFLLEGGYVERQGSQYLDCNMFSVSFQPAGFEHSYRAAETTCRAMTIELEDEWTARLRHNSVILESPINFHGGITLWLMTRLYNEFRDMQTGSALAIEALTLEIAIETLRRKKVTRERKAPLWLQQAGDLIHDHFADPLSLGQVASSVGVHPVHMARTFRQFHHCTVGEYLRRIRVEFACRKMFQTDLSLLEIALAAGFYDQSQFCRTFKLAIGMTPAEFRSNIRRR